MISGAGAGGGAGAGVGVATAGSGAGIGEVSTGVAEAPGGRGAGTAFTPGTETMLIAVFSAGDPAGATTCVGDGITAANKLVDVAPPAGCGLTGARIRASARGAAGVGETAGTVVSPEAAGLAGVVEIWALAEATGTPTAPFGCTTASPTPDMV